MSAWVIELADPGPEWVSDEVYPAYLVLERFGKRLAEDKIYREQFAAREDYFRGIDYWRMSYLPSRYLDDLQQVAEAIVQESPQVFTEVVGAGRAGACEREVRELIRMIGHLRANG